MSLTAENYKKGFLVDEELMGGVTEPMEMPGKFAAFVLSHATGEYLGYETFTDLEKALAVINDVKRAWAFEQVSGCGSCGKSDGTCAVAGSCGKKSATCSTGKC